MTHFARPRPNLTRPWVALAAVVVCCLGWSLPPGDLPSEFADAGTRVLGSGFETGVMRSTPTVAKARDVDRSIDRRPTSPLAAAVLLACLGAMALTVTTTTTEGRRAFGAESGSPRGSRGPPRLALT